MRLLLELKSLKDCVYDLKYYSNFQGFVYNLVKGTFYGSLHEREGYKYFCFSNLFQVKNSRVEQGVVYKWLVSSPNHNFIHVVKQKLLGLVGGKVNLGEYSFVLEGFKVLQPRIRDGDVLITGTPILLRIPKKDFGKYNIGSEAHYVYWNPVKEDDFRAFIKGLEDNLFKKYEQFYGVKTSREPLFESFRFLKSTCNHLVINGRETRVFGSLWEFPLSGLSVEQRKVLNFGLDTGFGERNTYGFGFTNIKEVNQID